MTLVEATGNDEVISTFLLESFIF